MAVKTEVKMLWCSLTANVASDWVFDSAHGVINGSIEIPQGYSPNSFILTGSRGSNMTGKEGINIKFAGLNGDYRVYTLSSTLGKEDEGLYMISTEVQVNDGTATVDAYTKAEVDSKLATKAAVGASYTKAEEDAKLSGKAAVGASYTKAEVDSKLAGKAAVGASYTKAEADAKFQPKAAS